MSWLIAFCDMVETIVYTVEPPCTFKEAMNQAIKDTDTKLLSLVRGAAEDLIVAIGQELQRR